jgi:hypothetical protein
MASGATLSNLRRLVLQRGMGLRRFASSSERARLKAILSIVISIVALRFLTWVFRRMFLGQLLFSGIIFYRMHRGWR